MIDVHFAAFRDLVGLGCIVLLLGGFPMAVFAFARSGAALGDAFDFGGWAWARTGGWGLLAYAVCMAIAGAVTYWISLGLR